MNQHVKQCIIAALGLSLIISAFSLTLRILNQARHPSKTPLHSLADQFKPLKPVFAGVARAGYYSDKNMEHPLALAQFQQAQYILAPTLLELNNTSLPVVIFDCTTPEQAMARIKEFRFQPVSASSTGLILAVRQGSPS